MRVSVRPLKSANLRCLVCAELQSPDELSRPAKRMHEDEADGMARGGCCEHGSNWRRGDVCRSRILFRDVLKAGGLAGLISVALAVPNYFTGDMTMTMTMTIGLLICCSTVGAIVFRFAARFLEAEIAR